MIHGHGIMDIAHATCKMEEIWRAWEERRGTADERTMIGLYTTVMIMVMVMVMCV